MCADATSAGLFPSMRGDHQLPLTGYAYLRIADHDLRQEIAKWCSKAVDEELLAPPGPPGSEESESRTSPDEMRVTIATGVTPPALEAIHTLKDQHCPFELQLEQIEIVEKDEGRRLDICIGVADTSALATLRNDLAAVGVSCGDEGSSWRVVVARVQNENASLLHRIGELRKDVERNKRIFLQRSCEATQLVVVMPPAAKLSETLEITEFDLAYKGGGI